MKNNKNPILDGNINLVFFKFLFNSVFAMLIVAFYIMVDTIFIGRGIGSDGLAALNIALPIFNILNATGLLFGMGGATALSISIGKNDIEESRRIFSQTMLTSVTIGIIYSILGVMFREKIAYKLGASDENISLVLAYLNGVFFMSFSFMLVHTTSSFVRNDNRPRLAMIATVIGGITNIILDYIFIFNFKMGMTGAALATSIASLLSLIILTSHFFSKNCSLKFVKFKFTIERLSRLLLNGTPSCIIELSSGIVIFIFNIAILNIIGEIGVSAYSIIANISLICTAIFTGIAQAIQPIISVNYGANKYDRVRRVKQMALIVAGVVGLLFYILGIIAPNLIVKLFTSESGQIIDITVNGIKYYFIGFLIMGFNIVLGSYYQSREFSVVSNAISMGRGIIFIIVGLIILPRIFGINGVWLTIVFSELMTMISLITYIKFFRKG